MEERKLSVLEVLRMNMGIMAQVRIPIGERQIWEAMQAVMQNEQACITAMEEQEAAAAAKAAETEEQDEQRDE